MTRILLRDLANMTDAEQAGPVRELLDPSKASAGITLLNSRIRAFESRYELSSDELLRGLEQGSIKETAELSEWLFYLEAKNSDVSA